MASRKPRLASERFYPLSARFDLALLFAAEVHRTQQRKKTGIPYLSHLLGVASIVLDYGGDEEMGIAALLHDAVEDRGGRSMLRSIEEVFGKRIAKIVDGCTDSYAADPREKEPWEVRKTRYLRRIGHEDAETRFVSAADKLYNSRAILRDLRNHGQVIFRQFSAPRERTLWYYRSLVKVYRSAGVTPKLKPLIDDLDRNVTAIEEIAGVSGHVKSTRKSNAKLEKRRHL